MSTDIRPGLGHSRQTERAEAVQVIIYEHSVLFYWWPLWVAGYFMALLTWLHHDQVIIGDKPVWINPGQNLGVIYTLLLLLLIVVTSTKIKGMKTAGRFGQFQRPVSNSYGVGTMSSTPATRPVIRV